MAVKNWMLAVLIPGLEESPCRDRTATSLTQLETLIRHDDLYEKRLPE